MNRSWVSLLLNLCAGAIMINNSTELKEKSFPTELKLLDLHIIF